LVADNINDVGLVRRWRFFGPADILEPLQGIFAVQYYYLSLGLRLCAIGSRYSILVQQEASNVAHSEWQVEMPAWVFNQILSHNPGALNIEKIRSRLILDGNDTLDVDIFTGACAGLILIKKEFKSTEEAAAFTLPYWLHDYSQEVTQYSEFTSYQLAKAGKIPIITIGADSL